MTTEVKAVCEVHAVVLRDVEDNLEWRREHEREDHNLRDWIQNEFARVRACIDERLAVQTRERREDIRGLHARIDRLQLLLLGSIISTTAGLLYLIITHALAAH